MTSQPEKLFRDTLESFQKSAPPAAWDRIEAKLDHTSNKGLWLKIAAGVLLLSVAAFLLWPTERTSNTEVLTKTSDPIMKKESTTAPEISTPQQIAEQKVTKKIVKPKNAKGLTETTPPLLATTVSVVANETSELAEIVIPTEVILAETTSSEAMVSTTLVYTADEVNARFLKKDLSKEATSEENKSSGIQKLIGLAYDLKHTDSGIGDLRQKKNEILALNFKEDKRGQNK